MVTGEVDVTWAKQHYDLWYEEISGQVESGQAEMDKKEHAKPD